MKQDIFSRITNIFKEDFNSSYKSIRGRNKPKLMRHLAAFYNKWLFSVLFDDTILSPANIIRLACKKNKINPTTLPVIKLREQGGFIFEPMAYSVDDHPVVNDLRLFLEHCTPTFDLNYNDMLVEEQVSSLYKSVSVCDWNYVQFLLMMSVYLELVEKIPSIHSNRAKPTQKCEEFFNLSKRKQLEAIFDVALDIALLQINNFLPFEEMMVTRDYLVELLKNPVSTDEIFRYLFDFMGLDINHLWDENESEITAALTSSTYLLGLILDKYFFTPFGHYLRIINPLYILSCDVFSELEYIQEAYEHNDDVMPAFLAPCSHYYLTDLGLEYFNLKPTKTNFLEIKTKSTFPAFMTSVYETLAEANLIKEQKPNLEVYSLKLRIAGRDIYWQQIDVLPNITLHELYSFICSIFNIEQVNDYSFFTDQNENRFSQYISPSSRSKAKKADKITLTELNLDKKQTITLQIRNVTNFYSKQKSTNIKISLELLNVNTSDRGSYYPKVAKLSKALRELNKVRGF